MADIQSAPSKTSHSLNADLQQALDETVLRSMRPLSLLLVGIFCVFLVFNLVDLPRGARLPVVVGDLVLIAVFYALWLVLRRGLLPSRWSHPVMATVACLVVANILLTLALLAEPFYTTYILIVVIGGGFFVLSTTWLIIAAAVIIGAWVAVVWSCCAIHDFIHYGFTLLSATMLSMVVHAIRIRIYRRLELLRLVDEQLKRDLEAALLSAERELVERKLAEERYRHLVQGIEAIVWEADPTSWQFTFVSDHAEQVLGHPPARWLEQPNFFLQCVHPQDRPSARAFCSGWQLGEHKSEFECRMYTSDGRIVWLRLNVTLARDAQGSPRQLRGLMVDITERRQKEEERSRLEDRLRHAQKMESLGNLAGGVAHDMNNILAAIMGLSSVIQQELEPSSALKHDLKDIISACRRGTNLTQNLLGFARKGKYRRDRVSLRRLIGEVSELVDRTLSKDIEVCRDLASDLADFEGDPNQIHHLLVNLTLNAADAMKGRGKLSFHASNVVLQAGDPQLPYDLEPGAYIKLEVSDTGVGMDEETIARAFEPFFTTKKVGEGTGLGLSMVYGTVKNHGGTVVLSSRLGEGTTVTLYLPALSEPSRVSQITEDLPSHQASWSGTVLLVDDEELVRAGCRRMLERLGFTVVTADSGASAVELFSRMNNAVDLVILDWVMPQMDGRETYERLRGIDEGIRVLFSSGYTRDATASVLFAGENVGFVQKPYEPGVLAHEIAKLLSTPPQDNLARDG